LIKTSPLACFGILLLGGIYAVLYAMSPVYATERGLTIVQTSYFITGIFLGGMLFQYPIGWLSDKFDRRYLIIGVTAAGSMVALFGLYFGDTFTALLVTAVALGGLCNPLYSLLVAYANDHLEYDQMASAAGGLLFINGCGAMTGPIIVGAAMTHLGIDWFFIILVLLLSAICFYGIYRISQRTYKVVDEATPYLPISANTTIYATGFAIDAMVEEQLEDLEEAEEIFESRPYDRQVIQRMNDQDTKE
ncbi:MAG: MFS family permease, partial [Pseudomonadales bacterium]